MYGAGATLVHEDDTGPGASRHFDGDAFERRLPC